MQEASAKGPPVLTAAAARARQGFVEAFGARPRIFQAPGRINIIGEHTDYSGGLVMPAAIDRHCLIAARATGDGRLNIIANTLGSRAALDLETLAPQGGWSDYVAGVAVALRTNGIEIGGAELWIDSDVPIGGGVSSSAALEVATAVALLALAEHPLDMVRVAQWAQTAENDFVGMPCGIMDQFASANGVPGHALMLNCATLSYSAVRLPHQSSFLIIDSMVRHAHVEGAYRDRREDCEAAARALGLDQLSQASPEDLARGLPLLTPPQARRARHVISENQRVRRAAEAMQRGDLKSLGALMAQSHLSLRDQMEVSDPKVDQLVELALAVEGVFGARMMGGGFGGCIIVLVAAKDASQVSSAIQDRYRQAAGAVPEAFVCRAVGGAGEVLS